MFPLQNELDPKPVRYQSVITQIRNDLDSTWERYDHNFTRSHECILGRQHASQWFRHTYQGTPLYKFYTHCHVWEYSPTSAGSCFQIVQVFSRHTLGMTKMRIKKIKIPKLRLKREAPLCYMKTLYKRQFTGKKKKKMLYTFRFSPSQWFPKEDSVVKATHFFFFFCISLICWKSEPLKHLVNGRDAVGGDEVWGEEPKWICDLVVWCGQQGSWWEMLQQTWPLNKGSVKNTVQV